MANLFRRCKPQTTTAYLDVLEKRLRWQLPQAKVAEVCQEVEAHLSDRVAELMEAGIPEARAHQQAISGFGPTDHYARRVATGAYNDGVSRAARVLVLVAVALLLLYLLLSTVVRWYLTFNTVLVTLLVLLLLVSAFIGKKPQIQAIAALGVVFALTTWVLGGLYWRTGYRGTMTGDLVGMGHRIQEQYEGDQKGVIWLKAGTETAKAGTKFAPFLRVGDRFIVPRPMAQWKSFAKAFHQVPPAKLQQAIYAREGIGESSDVEAFRAQPFFTVTTEPEARTLWRERGSQLLPQAVQSLRRSTREARLYPTHYLTAKRFDPSSGNQFIGMTLILTTLLLVVDAVVALMGRFTYLWWRNQRWKRQIAS